MSRLTIAKHVKELEELQKRVIRVAQNLYDSLPVTLTPQEFMAGKGCWGLTQNEFKLATRLARIITKKQPK